MKIGNRRSGVADLRGVLTCVLASLVFLVGGCVTPPFEEVAYGDSYVLGPDEGFLILSIDTDVPLDWIDLDSNRAASNLPKGQHLWVVRAKAGHYKWSSLRVSNSQGKAGLIDLQAQGKALRRYEDWVWDDEMEFDVDPGQINYPGELIIQSDISRRSAGRGYWVRNRNHSAEAVRKLQKKHAALLAAYPLHFSGPGGDEFLDYYSRKRTERTLEVGP